MRILTHYARGGMGLLACLALTAGCGSAGDGAAARSNVAPAPAPTTKVNEEATRLTATMVAAVSAGKSASSVDLRYGFDEPPKVGKPLKITVALIPLVDLERLFARFQSVDGVEVLRGAETAPLTRPEKGVPITHTVTVMPKRDGIFALPAMVLFDSDTESVARSFSIPLIAGAGLPAPPAASDAAPVRTAGTGGGASP